MKPLGPSTSIPENSTLPQELLYDILSSLYVPYLHQAIVGTGVEDGAMAEWNAFIVLPAVSRVFHHLSQPIFRKIFGEEDNEPIDYHSRKERFRKSKALWLRASITTSGPWDPDAESFSPNDIPRIYKPLPPPSLLRVYDLISLGRYYFITKAVHLEDEKTKCTLRLWCPYMGQALGICDEIFPRRLLKYLGPHLVSHTTNCYSLECIEVAIESIQTVLKHSEWLNFSTVEYYTSENIQSLERLEKNSWDFLWLNGYIRSAFTMSVVPDASTLQRTGINDILRAVIAHDWNEDVCELKDRANRLLQTYLTRMGVSDD